MDTNINDMIDTNAHDETHDETHDDTYLIELQGKNTDKHKNCKVSLNKIIYVEQHKWYLDKNGYPFTFIKGSRVRLHRYIWYLNTGTYRNNNYCIDHINRDKLDARDSNLRLVTPAQNSYNKTPKDEMKHHITMNKNGYIVKITKNNQVHKVDNIKSYDDAKNIYNMIATELFGEYAILYK